MESSPENSDGEYGYDDLFAIGEYLGEVYEIQSLLGQGGMGQVYEAYDHMLARTVAIKASWPHVCPAGLRDESRAMAAMGTRHVPTVYGMGAHHGIPYCVMERLHGTTLADHMSACMQLGHMDLNEALDILISIAWALSTVHDTGLSHRDLKPANIMLAPDDRTVLLDFGLFVSYGRAHLETGICGSPRYMAPEAITERVQPGQEHLLDIYALGIIAYVMLARQHPFQNCAGQQVLWQHVYGTPSSMRLARIDIPSRLDRLVLELLNKDPMERPFSAQAVAVELQNIRARLDI